MKNKILYERSLRTCIIMLIVCIVFKLFGVKWFDLNTSIPILQKLDNLISNNFILSFVFTLIIKNINGILIFSIISKNMKFTLKHLKLIILSNILNICVCYFMGECISFIIDIIFVLIIGCKVLNINFKETLLCIPLNIIYQMISLFIRNISLGFRYYGFIENQLLCLDYYILLLITYLFLNKGGVYTMWENPSYFFFPSHKAMEKAFKKLFRK